MTPDVNVLVAASRADHPHHVAALGWLEQAIENAPQVAPLALQPMVSASFLRLVTHPKIFVNPTPIAEALRFVDALLAMPGVNIPALGDEWPTFRALCANKALTANDLPDAWLAAAVIHQGEHLVTFDKDFRRLLGRNQFTRLEARVNEGVNEG
jgi:toxin-antitoxin system PIN domain toxin